MHISQARSLQMALFLALSKITCFGQPAFIPSAHCVHTNESLFLKGIGFAPSDYIQGFVTSSYNRSPLWSFDADTNGEFLIDITFRSNIDMTNQQRAVQVYNFQSSRTNVYFAVWYQTYNPTNDWNAVITSIRVYPVDYATNVLQVDIFASVFPSRNNYQIQMANDLKGPWVGWPGGGPTMSENPYTNLYFGLQIPTLPKAFFRLTNPYLPCPCDF